MAWPCHQWGTQGHWLFWVFDHQTPSPGQSNQGVISSWLVFKQHIKPWISSFDLLPLWSLLHSFTDVLNGFTLRRTSNSKEFECPVQGLLGCVMVETTLAVHVRSALKHKQCSFQSTEYQRENMQSHTFFLPSTSDILPTPCTHSVQVTLKSYTCGKNATGVGSKIVILPPSARLWAECLSFVQLIHKE